MKFNSGKHEEKNELDNGEASNLQRSEKQTSVKSEIPTSESLDIIPQEVDDTGTNENKINNNKYNNTEFSDTYICNPVPTELCSSKDCFNTENLHSCQCLGCRYNSCFNNSADTHLRESVT